MREYATFLIFPILAVFIFVSYQNWGKSDLFPVDFIDKESLAIEERNYAGPGFKHWNRSHIFASLTRRLSAFEILNNATLIFQKWLISRHFANIFHYLNFSEEYL